MTRLEALAQIHTANVLDSSVAIAIEKITTEAVAEMLRDPAFREELKAIARQTFTRAVRDLRGPRRRAKR